MEESFSSPSMADFPLSMHLTMVKDAVRVRAFERALRSVMTPGCTVVDVGSGTGVLAFLAARHGAGKVVGLERSDLARYARRVKARAFPDAPVTFIRRDVVTESLPRVRADVVVCELLGNFGVEENIVEVLEKVRTHLLAPGGVIIPRDLELIAAPVQCAQGHRDVAAWSKPIWGIDFSPLQELAYNTVYQAGDQPMTILAMPEGLARVDFATTTRLPRSVDARYRFTRRGVLHGFAGWFRAVLAPGHVLDTGPDRPATHWGQVFFPVGDPIPVERGGVAEFRFAERNSARETRWSWSGSVRSSPRARRRHAFSFSATRPPHYEEA